MLLSDPLATTPRFTSPILYREAPPHSRQDLDRWQRELETAVPKHDQLTYLRLRWEPGDMWEPVQRYVLWEMIPNEVDGKPIVPPEVRAILEGPDVRSKGHYDPRKGSWVGGLGNGLVDRATQALFRETGRWGMRYWVIQGENGGHPILVPWIVKVTSALIDKQAPEPPAPGDLPYAEPSSLTWRKVMAYDRFRRWRQGKDWLFRTDADVKQEERDDAERGAAEMTVWWDEQMAEVLDEHKRHLAEIGWAAKGSSFGTGDLYKNVHTAESSGEAMRDAILDQV